MNAKQGAVGGIREHVASRFRQQYGGPPAWLVRAPGRVNLIGEHTDYNDGFVLPMAIDRASWIAVRPRTDRKVCLYSTMAEAPLEFDLDRFERGRGWGEYVKAVAWALRQGGHALRGWDGVTATDAPLEAGLSSSASFELAVARCFAAASDFAWDPVAMARLCQRAENEWVGVQCGIMDQLISAVGRVGSAVLIDCRDLSTRAAPLPPRTAVVILDTDTRRGLVDSAYNERRTQCRAAADHFGVAALRDLPEDAVRGPRDSLDPVAFRRARHVVTENARTLQAFEALQKADPARLGILMNASHASLKLDFEVSSPELDAMVESARACRACFGARMTGAGFGGCAVALAAAENVEAFCGEVALRYAAVTGRTPRVYVCRATDGAQLLTA